MNRKRLWRVGGMFVATWIAGAALGALDHQHPAGSGSRSSMVRPAYAQPGATTCLIGSNFDDGTTQGWTATAVDPASGIRPGGSTITPPVSTFYYHLKDASGASNLNAPAAFLGDLVKGLAPGCRRQFCFDINLFVDGDNNATAHPSFAATFSINTASGSATFASTTMVSEPGGADAGWHRVCAPFQILSTGQPLPPGWRLFDTAGVLIPAPTAAQWNAMMTGPVTAMRFPVDWGSPQQLEEVGYDNFCVSDSCECVTFTQTKVSCAVGPSGPSGCYTVTTLVTNNTGQPASFVMLGSTGVSPNVIPLVPPLPSGQSRPITFTYCPPTSSTATTASVDISLAGAGGEPCCRQTLRFDLPPCPRPECLWVPKYSTSCVTGAPPGTFKLWFNYRNMTNCPTNLFLLASPPSTATASYFAGPYLPFSGTGPTYNVPVTITGATSSTFCMVISQQCKQGGNCCSRTVCFTVPNCWPDPMPSPTPDIGRPPIDPNPGD